MRRPPRQQQREGGVQVGTSREEEEKVMQNSKIRDKAETETREQHPLLGHAHEAPRWSHPVGWRMQAKSIPADPSLLGLARKRLHLNRWTYCFSSVRT